MRQHRTSGKDARDRRKRHANRRIWSSAAAAAGARASSVRPGGSKRWPARAFRARRRRCAHEKRRHCATSERGEHGTGGEKHAPATFSRAAAPDSDVGGAAGGIIPARTRWCGAAGARRRRAKSSRADPVARPGRDSGSCRPGVPREPPPRQGIHPRSVLSRRDRWRDRRVGAEIVT